MSESKGDDSSDLSTFRRSPTPETVKNNQKKGSLSAMRLAQNVAGKPLNIFPQKKYHFYKKPDPRLYKKNKSSLNISRPCYPEGGKERNSVTT